MTRRLVGVGILSAWVVSMAALLGRQMAPAPSALAGLEERLPPGDAFLRVVVGGRQVGLFSTAVDTTATGVRAVERVDLSLPDAGSGRRITQGTQLTFGRGLALTGLDLTRGGDVPRLRAAMALDSAGRSFGLTLQARGDTASSRTARPPGPALGTPASLLRLAGLRPELIAADPRHEVLDPLGLDWVEVELRLGPDTVVVVPDSAALDPSGRWVEARWDTVAAYPVTMRAWGLPFEGIVDVDGNLVRLTTPLGATWERTAFEIVRTGYDPEAVVARAAPEAVRARPGTAGAPLRVLLRQRSEGRVVSAPFLAGAGQTVMGDTLLVQPVTLAAATTGEPVVGGAVWLRGSPAHPAEDPKVKALARRILQEGMDPAARVEALIRWIEGEVDIASSGPDHPLAALQHGRASPQGAVALFVTLARAAGLPARPVAGYRLTGGRMVLDGWAEVAVPGWLPVDPVRARAPAPADRVRLVEGVPADPLILLPLIGGVEAIPLAPGDPR